MPIRSTPTGLLFSLPGTGGPGRTAGPALAGGGGRAAAGAESAVRPVGVGAPGQPNPQVAPVPEDDVPGPRKTASRRAATRATSPTAGPRLSARERQALSLIAAGYTHAQAADRMGVSKCTVDSYLERIRAKLGPGNKADLTRAALRLAATDLPGEISG